MTRITICAVVLLLAPTVCSSQIGTSIAGARDAIVRGKYAYAAEDLEELARRDTSGEARTYLATARMYRDRRFYDSLEDFGEAFAAGGGASFIVAHSHEVMSDAEVVNVCRGWLHFRSGRVEFESSESGHAFAVTAAEVREVDTNRLARGLFHIRIGDRKWNFRTRTATRDEAQLVVAIYSKCVRSAAALGDR
ncbi:MAG: hypothetical protein IT175_08495 [Acidobacteria bacterium]|nr:hypothetical protein [Acidobacteriota bacterium]